MVERSVKSEHGVDLFLPPGFRFHPTDEEVITSYLLQKFLNPSFEPYAIGEVDLNKCEPWDLPSKAKMGEKEWYFFCHKDMKYPTGTRTNRATKEGYWKATGKDREIFKQPGRELVGMKKTLVFYMGRAPRGTKTNWVMHEFRLEGKSRHTNDSNLRFNPKDEWVVCKVHHKGGEEACSTKKAAAAEEQYYSSAAGTPNVSSVEAGEGGDEFLVDSLLDYSSYFNSAAAPPYNADCGYYPVHTTTTATGMTAPTTTTTSSCFVGLPTDGSNSQHAAAVASSAAAATNNNDSSSWTTNMLRHPADQEAAMGRTNYSLQYQAMVAKALGGGGGASPTNFAAGLPAGSSVAAAAGIAQNVLLHQRLAAGNYGGNYAAGYHTRK